MWVSTRVEVTFHATTSFDRMHVILKTITRTRTLKGGGFGLTGRLLDHTIYSQYAQDNRLTNPNSQV